MVTRLAAHPFITAIVSLVLATLSYAALFGWRVAIALILVLLVHELGHVAAGRLLHLPLRMLVFVPFLGAFVAFKEEARIVEQHTVLALPLLFEALRGDRGDREAIAFYAASPAQQVWAVAAYTVTAAVLVSLTTVFDVATRESWSR